MASIKNISKRKNDSLSKRKSEKETLKKNNHPKKQSLKKNSSHKLKQTIKKHPGGGMFKSLTKGMGRMAAEARGAVEGVTKAGQLAYRAKQIGSIYAFMPNYVEVVGRSGSGTGGGVFTKDMYMNLKDNLVTLASIDSVTLKKMLLVNPEDIADYTRAYKWIRKKGPSINGNSNQSVFDNRLKMGINIKKRTDNLKADMRSIVEKSIVSTPPAGTKYKAFKTEEINDILQPDIDKSTYKDAEYEDYENPADRNSNLGGIAARIGNVGTFLKNRAEGARATFLSTSEKKAKEKAKIGDAHAEAVRNVDR